MTEPTQQSILLHKKNRPTIIAAGLISVILFTYLTATYGWRQGTLLLVGLIAGISLYHAAFGFTAAWREVVLTGRSAGLRAQMVMLGITVLIFTPLIGLGEFGGIDLRGNVAPLNLSLIHI